jgi:uncharacterized membrane protein YgcG
MFYGRMNDQKRRIHNFSISKWPYPHSCVFKARYCNNNNDAILNLFFLPGEWYERGLRLFHYRMVWTGASNRAGSGRGGTEGGGTSFLGGGSSSALLFTFNK